ncbi:MAG: hypothetical protein IH957_02385 [Chloroflexi bacterium]|nr:hypothetical protein [Chloroflexota bacterium]
MPRENDGGQRGFCYEWPPKPGKETLGGIITVLVTVGILLVVFVYCYKDATSAFSCPDEEFADLCAKLDRRIDFVKAICAGEATYMGGKYFPAIPSDSLPESLRGSRVEIKMGCAGIDLKWRGDGDRDHVVSGDVKIVAQNDQTELVDTFLIDCGTGTTGSTQMVRCIEQARMELADG